MNQIGFRKNEKYVGNLCFSVSCQPRFTSKDR